MKTSISTFLSFLKYFLKFFIFILLRWTWLKWFLAKMSSTTSSGKAKSQLLNHIAPSTWKTTEIVVGKFTRKKIEEDRELSSCWEETWGRFLNRGLLRNTIVPRCLKMDWFCVFLIYFSYLLLYCILSKWIENNLIKP